MSEEESIDYPESEVNKYNSKFKDIEEIEINDFSKNQNSMTDFKIKIKQTKYGQFETKKVIQKLANSKANYIGLNVLRRNIDLYRAIEEVSAKNEKFIDLPFNINEIDISKDDITAEFKPTKDNIELAKSTFENLQDQINGIDEANENYQNLQKKHIDVIRYVSNINQNLSQPP